MDTLYFLVSIDINSNIITRPMIANIISSAFSTAKIVETSADPLDNIETAFNTLIENIQDSILAITTENKVMSWARELSYVSTLIQLNSGEVFTFLSSEDCKLVSIHPFHRDIGLLSGTVISI